MNEMQTRLREMMQSFHGFCVKHNLRYYLVAGTCLGAVRHKGFIPWDDDIDVGMPRADYNRLIELVKTEKMGENYAVEDPLENDDYIYAFAKMYDTSTTLIENTANKLKRGIYIDIFPLDGVGNTLDEAKAHFAKVDKQVNMLRAKVCAFSKKRKFYKNAIIAAFRLLPVTPKGLIRKIVTLSESKAFDDYEYIGTFVGGWHFKEVVKKEYFGEPKIYEFEGLEVYGPSNADAYLTNLYGDYMQLPPKEKQISHHDFIALDFNKGYIDGK